MGTVFNLFPCVYIWFACFGWVCHHQVLKRWRMRWRLGTPPVSATLGYGIQTLRNPGLNFSNFGTSDFDASFWRENNPEGSSCKLNVARLWGKLYFSKRKSTFLALKGNFFNKKTQIINFLTLRQMVVLQGGPANNPEMRPWQFRSEEIKHNFWALNDY